MSETFVRAPRVNGAWLHSAAIGKVFAALEAGKAEARIVGGAVRNALIDRPVHEVDIATTAVPEEVMRLALEAGLGAHPTGIDHGTVTVVADGVPFEVTTLRRDVETDGRHAVVAFTTVWQEDAARRDFTINALYCGKDGTLYDPVGGLDDLRKRRVRFIGDAEARIREDYLRILRFFRFSAAYGNGQLDRTGLAAVIALKDGLSRLSPERVRAEILKLLAARNAAEVVSAMHESGVLQLAIPTTADPERLTRLQAIERALGQPPDALARLAALAVDEPSQALSLAQHLRLSNAEAEVLQKAAVIHPALDPADARSSGADSPLSVGTRYLLPGRTPGLGTFRRGGGGFSLAHSGPAAGPLEGAENAVHWSQRRGSRRGARTAGRLGPKGLRGLVDRARFHRRRRAPNRQAQGACCICTWLTIY